MIDGTPIIEPEQDIIEVKNAMLAYDRVLDLRPTSIIDFKKAHKLFIHPFTDGNGRMGRLWQHLILAHFHDIFQFITIETLIKECQKDYYTTLAQCDTKGNSTDFIEFCLKKYYFTTCNN